MTDFIANVIRWRERAKIDFFAEFVKAWIPFNAWYRQSYNSNSDREIINVIKHDSPVKTQIKHLLEGTDERSHEFQNYVSKFHRQLENLELKNAGRNVNFTSIILERNKIQKSENKYRGLHYCASENNGIFCCVMKDANQKKYINYSHNEYNINHFNKYLENTNITDLQKQLSMACFKEINPFIPINLTEISDKYIVIGDYKFCNDIDLICKAIIENIYSLRCMLFHGEIEPSLNNETLYETAYHILKFMIEAIN